MGLQDVDIFVRNVLRPDGVFILRIMSINAGDLITADIIVRLWEIHQKVSSSTIACNKSYLYLQHLKDVREAQQRAEAQRLQPTAPQQLDSPVDNKRPTLLDEPDRPSEHEPLLS